MEIIICMGKKLVQEKISLYCENHYSVYHYIERLLYSFFEKINFGVILVVRVIMLLDCVHGCLRMQQSTKRDIDQNHP